VGPLIPLCSVVCYDHESWEHGMFDGITVNLFQPEICQHYIDHLWPLLGAWAHHWIRLANYSWSTTPFQQITVSSSILQINTEVYQPSSNSGTLSGSPNGYHILFMLHVQHNLRCGGPHSKFYKVNQPITTNPYVATGFISEGKCTPQVHEGRHKKGD